jgi:putative copper resistance protein D
MSELTLNPWLLAQIISKVFIYLGTAAAVGGLFISQLNTANLKTPWLRSYISSGVMLGFSALIINFFLQVGDFSSTGLDGMFDKQMIDILWHSPVGLSVQLRMAGFIGLSICLTISTIDILSSLKTTIGFATTYLLSITILFIGFSSTGHISESGSISRLLISLHIFSALWWAGALLPLWILTQQSVSASAINSLQHVMHRFGQWAVAVVILLVSAGSYLLINLVGNIEALFSTAYGLSFLIKLIAVSSMLLLAANHKLRLVPSLTSPLIRQKLSRSITWETLLACAVLILSAILTTAMGPPAH